MLFFIFNAELHLAQYLSYNFDVKILLTQVSLYILQILIDLFLQSLVGGEQVGLVLLAADQVTKCIKLIIDLIVEALDTVNRVLHFICGIVNASYDIIDYSGLERRGVSLTQLVNGSSQALALRLLRSPVSLDGHQFLLVHLAFVLCLAQHGHGHEVVPLHPIARFENYIAVLVKFLPHLRLPAAEH